jgi:hypothetical protein
MASRLEFCPLDDAEALMRFFREHWSENHVLGHSRALLDWQHRDGEAGRYNFLVARLEDGAIAGILGFIPASRFDPALAAEDETVWLTNWKVIEPGVGLMMLRDLTRRLAPRWIGTAGLNPQTRGIYQALGYRTGKLERFYRLNPALAGRRLASVPEGWPSPARTLGETPLHELQPEEFMLATEGLALDESGQTPRKSRALLAERYLAHPFYRYRVFMARDRDRACAIVMRACTHEGATALRVVDLIGDAESLAGCGPAFDALLATEGAEYVDFYCSGAQAALRAAGFEILEADGPLVLPSYFEPFDRSNVEILWSLKGPGEPVVICKGDADQDRPSLAGVTV